MNSKISNQTSRRYPLKRVRTNHENQGFIPSLSNGRIFKKFCQQSSQDSTFVEIEKSSDERAFDLFHKEYFHQIRPYFKHRSIAQQLIEHLWNNMIESSKIAFIKKILKEQKFSDSSSMNYNDENDCQLEKSFNQSNDIHLELNSSNRYSRGFINDFLSYLKHSISPRFIDMISSTKLNPPLRRSSRIRRAPIKCLCSTCTTNNLTEEHSFSNEHSENQRFAHLITHYHQRDDEYVDNQFDNLIKYNENPIESLVSQTNENEEDIQSSSVISDLSVKNNEETLPSMDLSNEKHSLIMSDSLTTNECPIQRTYVIFTELDEPFFGPYPIEFTITI